MVIYPATTIRNRNTYAAYHRAVCHFFARFEEHVIDELVAIEPLHVAAYIEALQTTAAKPTVKLHLAAIRMLFNWLVVGQVVDQNHAAPVGGPRQIVKKGKTPVLDGDEARKLLDSIDVSTIVGLGDRALIALLIYSFAWISAALLMKVDDYCPQGKRWRGAPARKRRQAARDASASSARKLSRRLCDGRRPCGRKKRAAVPHARRPRPQTAERMTRQGARRGA
jgi:site-specific recombinase XerD